MSLDVIILPEIPCIMGNEKSKTALSVLTPILYRLSTEKAVLIVFIPCVAIAWMITDSLHPVIALSFITDLRLSQ